MLLHKVKMLTGLDYAFTQGEDADWSGLCFTQGEDTDWSGLCFTQGEDTVLAAMAQKCCFAAMAQKCCFSRNGTKMSRTFINNQ